MLRKLITTAAAAAGLALTLGTTAASAADGPNIGVRLSSTPTLTLAAPNNVVSGKNARLKTCLNGGDCANGANLKDSETFNFVPSTSAVAGFEIRLHGTSWCVTSRHTSVFFEACHNYASQIWSGDSCAVNVGPIVITNAKTGRNLTHTGVAAFQPVVVSSQLTHWSNSS
jgi:hypothetical protein